MTSDMLFTLAEPVLRHTQLKACELFRDGTIQKAHDDDVMPVMQMACGAGKTWVLLYWAIKYCKEGERVVIVTFKKDPVRQIMDDYNYMRKMFVTVYQEKYGVGKRDAIMAVEQLLGGIGKICSGQNSYEKQNTFDKNRIIVINVHMLCRLSKSCLRMISGVAVDEVQFVSTNQMTKALCSIRQARKPDQRDVYLFGVSATPNARSDGVAIGGFHGADDRNTLVQYPRFFQIGSELESVQKGETRPMMLTIVAQKLDTEASSFEQKLLLLITLAIKKVVEISDYKGDPKAHRLIMVKVDQTKTADDVTKLINSQRFSRVSGDAHSTDKDYFICAVALHHEIHPKKRLHILDQLKRGREFDIVVVDRMLNDSYSNSRVSVVCLPYRLNRESQVVQIASRTIRATGGRISSEQQGDLYLMQRETGYIFALEDNISVQDYFDNVPSDLAALNRKLSFPRTSVKQIEGEVNQGPNQHDEGEMESDVSDTIGEKTVEEEQEAASEFQSDIESDGEEDSNKRRKLGEKDIQCDKNVQVEIATTSHLLAETRQNMVCRCKLRVSLGLMFPPMNMLGMETVYITDENIRVPPMVPLDFEGNFIFSKQREWNQGLALMLDRSLADNDWNWKSVIRKLINDGIISYRRNAVFPLGYKKKMHDDYVKSCEQRFFNAVMNIPHHSTPNLQSSCTYWYREEIYMLKYDRGKISYAPVDSTDLLR